MDYTLPLEMLYRWEKERADEIYLSQPIDGKNHEWSWKETSKEVRKMAAYLKDNLPENSKIGILSKNCAHWIMSDLAIMMAGHISVPLYPNLRAEALKSILDHSQTKFLFVGKLDNFNDMKSGIDDDIKCVTYPFYSQNYEIWDNVIEGINPISENVNRDQSELATIIYTSGTTGDPKGVMHKFFNFGFATVNAVNAVKLSKETFFSYLPLSHIAERLLVEMGSLYTGGKISFAESLDTFAKNLADASPSVFLGVPRIWTKFQQGVIAKLGAKKLNFLLSVPIISSIIKKKIKSNLGLSNAKNIFTGAAPTPESLIYWFKKLDIHIQEAYAMTENCCYSHVTLNDAIKVGSVGKNLPHCDVKLSSENEILIKHKALMDGYYKSEKLTNETIKNGWLHTGDVGEIDSEGYLKITGRVKDIFKTTKGEYISPSKIEMKLSEDNNIEQVCIVGRGLTQPIALITLSLQAEKLNKIELKEYFKFSLNSFNKNLANYEKISQFVVLKTEWTVENNFLTPSMKIKRNTIESAYSKRYPEWESSSEKVIFIN
ncbi:MAG: hypothetical protein CBC44_002825 [Flavobacteriales bacterium TMED84]|nr:MAG: hypothetical protein CBC44_002825 [Flavobacteriales bacterium TMED84]|tara:strand:+ start:4489 stop:6123 length:1635 start_codon:yes stop_codon:yes gene_type:complete